MYTFYLHTVIPLGYSQSIRFQSLGYNGYKLASTVPVRCVEAASSIASLWALQNLRSLAVCLLNPSSPHSLSSSLTNTCSFYFWQSYSFEYCPNYNSFIEIIYKCFNSSTPQFLYSKGAGNLTALSLNCHYCLQSYHCPSLQKINFASQTSQIKFGEYCMK